METIASLLFPLSFFSLLALERLLPGRPMPKVRFWVPKGIVFFLMGGVINAVVPAIAAKIVAGRALFDLRALPVAAGTLVAIFVTTFIGYWLHRLVHRVGWLWRWTHQLHHSAERVDISGFAYTHPFDLGLGVLVNSMAVALLGISPTAALVSGYATFMVQLFAHLNLRTPQRLGYLVQRPEAHCVHHQRGVHAYNYGLPLWDLLFGTFRNPAEWRAQAGFWDGASKRLGALLAGRDVTNAPRA
jgi:sterol desaturase/sphingolipid hydroxylase (fatty acid hydroxylase superfamily)